MQKILNNYDELTRFLNESDSRNILFVHGKSFSKFEALNKYICSLDDKKLFHFTGFNSNPDINEAKDALDFAEKNNCEAILVIGGGSAIDTAKYVKLHKNLPMIAIPTTAGSGSEATRFAVLYEDGRKLSLTDDNMIPDAILFDSKLLQYLPEYHIKSSALDAFSHALESFWSVNANSESQNFSREALSEITSLLEDYPDSYRPEKMLLSSYKAGRAINISQTTAGHAMCYKLTGLFKIAHGHAAALCNRVLFKWLIRNKPSHVLNDIADSMSCKSPEEAAEKFCDIFDRLALEIPRASSHDIEILAESVNPERLKNFPCKLDRLTIKNLYQEILNTNGR